LWLLTAGTCPIGVARHRRTERAAPGKPGRPSRL